MAPTTTETMIIEIVDESLEAAGISLPYIKKQLGDKYPEDFGEMNPKTAKKARRHASPLVVKAVKSAEAKSLIKKAARGEKWRTIQTIPKGAKKQPAAKSDAKPQKKKVKPAAKEPEPVVADESSDPDEEE
ncbi:hypothetical protein EMIHUDRAFT_112300 [Emiliania huxleyi CCMP1516]|nr:hypothetical protein EMIHUDRAFT_112300 [Emiliania huxleyi CCMP1516]EOD32594.1 hypothetical protein EMIHUDRAFT_112300 [Emiliania huxleyi CCMP1516]|eukprot:XP_005785023.1 hypothetical protein EMIHUDRAFT_112300 [Emiliania huxleyi CCMP1516]